MNPATHLTRINGFAPVWPAAVLDDALASATPARPRIVGLSGVQGCGKSTLAAQVVELARARGLEAATLSLDDVYLPRAERQRLAAEVHPLLATRGPAGSHDLALALATLDALRAAQPVRLPRFDKLADDRLHERDWPLQQRPLDLLVIEGWLLGTPAEPPAALVTPLNPLEREHDRDGRWRRYCNQALQRDYPPLWARLDRLWLLQAPDFSWVPEWRWQQEQALQARSPERAAMSRAQIDHFVQFFERGSRQALRTLPMLADRVVQLDRQRRITTPPPDPVG